VVRRRLGITVAAAVAAAVAVPKIVPATAIERSVSFLVGNGSGLSSNGRTHLWSEAWHAFVTHPLFGLGTGGFAQIEPVYQYPHNVILEAAAELGLVGLVVLLAFLVPTVKPLLAAWRSSTGAERAAAALIAALLASSVVNALLSDSLEASSGIWFAAGLAYGLAARLQPARAEATAPGPAPAAAAAPLPHRP
jgi:O-antigen ligase